MLGRQVIATIVTWVILNKDMKKHMYDSVPEGEYKNILFTVLIGLVSKVLMFSTLKYFMLTTVAVFNNLEAFTTLSLGFYLLKEDVRRTDCLEVSVIIVSVIIISAGMKEEQASTEKGDGHSYAKVDHFTVLRFIGLLTIPIIHGIQNIMTRSMRKLNENTMACFINPSHTIFAIIILCLLGEDWWKYLYTMFTTDYRSSCIFLIAGTLKTF
jgi:drug/metabolite transporter (DMT)-like permease